MTEIPQTIAEQLGPLQPVLRGRQSSVVPVSQVLLHLRGADSSKRFEQTRDGVLAWIANRAGRALPESAWKDEAFDLEDIGSQRVSAVVLDSPRYWAARLDDADKMVAQRTWVTEVGIAQGSNDVVILGVRLVCVTRGRDESFQRSIPVFVRQIAKPGIAFLDSHPIRDTPWLVSTEEDVEALVRLLRAPRRTDVIVFSLPERSIDPAETAAPANEVHQRTLGAAHVAVLTGPASYFLSDRLGKEFSVFLRAVRTYRPGFNPDVDEPYVHPLALPPRIAEWPGGGSAAYAAFLVDQSLSRSATRSDSQDMVPPFATIRQLASQARLAAARRGVTSDKDLLAIAEDEIKSLKAALVEEKKTSGVLIQTAEKERDDAKAEAQAAIARSAAMRSRIESLEYASSGERDPGVATSVPDTLEEFPDWCVKHLSGFVEVHNRAHQGIKKSLFEDVPFIYKVLLLMRDFYVPMRRFGGPEHKAAYEARCRELGVVETPTGSRESLGEQGETYVIVVGARPRLLERHMKKGGNTRDPSRCFRLYFYWDDQSEQVIVGWLPSHLESRAT